MTAPLPEWLISYVDRRDAERADAVNAVLGALTERERRLVRDAAVMGYVQGRRHPAGEDPPKDSTVVTHVIGGCLANADLYPVLTGVRPCGECDHPGYVHGDGDDPVTPGTCRQCEAEESDDAHHDYSMKG